MLLVSKRKIKKCNKQSQLEAEEETRLILRCRLKPILNLGVKLNEMNKIELLKENLEELDDSQLVRISGGFANPFFIAVGGYMLYQIAANPYASYQAFMEGWNSF